MLKVLVVEDEKMLRKGLIFTVHWQEQGCVVVAEAENGKEGLELIQKQHPDIVITDIRMPLMDGLTMLENSLQEDYSAIIISSYNEFDYAKKALKFGVCEYILKPVDPQELEESLQKARRQLQMRRMYRERMNNSEKEIHISLIDHRTDVQDVTAINMQEYIESHYADKIVMEDLSRFLHYSESFLNRKFKESFQYTFNDYLNRYRIHKSIEMIQKCNEPLEAIAGDCGFANYKYFSSVFRKYVGCSPKEYQQYLHRVQTREKR